MASFSTSSAVSYTHLVNDRACKVLAGLAFGLESGTDFTAGVSGVILVHNVADVYKRQGWGITIVIHRVLCIHIGPGMGRQ